MAKKANYPPRICKTGRTHGRSDPRCQGFGCAAWLRGGAVQPFPSEDGSGLAPAGSRVVILQVTQIFTRKYPKIMLCWTSLSNHCRVVQSSAGRLSIKQNKVSHFSC